MRHEPLPIFADPPHRGHQTLPALDGQGERQDWERTARRKARHQSRPGLHSAVIRQERFPFRHFERSALPAQARAIELSAEALCDRRHAEWEIARHAPTTYCTAFTIARMPTRTASGKTSQRSTINANSSGRSAKQDAKTFCSL